MKRADLVGGVIAVLFGGFAITQSLQLGYWSPFGPGPGFIPLWSSIIIVLGGVLLTLQALRRKAAASRPLDRAKIKGLMTVGAVTVLTMAAAILMDYLGFTASIFVYVSVLTGSIGKHKWHAALATGALTAIAFYVVFARWLQVPLPKGIMGF